MDLAFVSDREARELHLICDLDYFQRIPFDLIADTEDQWSPDNAALIRSQMVIRIVARLLRISDTPSECFALLGSLYRSAWEEVSLWPTTPSLLTD